MIPTARVFPIPRFLFKRVAWLILECARRTSTFLSCAFREQEDGQATRPPFFSILIGSRVTGLMPGGPFVRECHGSIPFAKYFRHSIHQFGDSLDFFRRKILSKSRV